jgi:hypothetical protein
MSIFFKAKDVIHSITVKFYPARLPGAKKPYILRAVHQPELDIHEIASKAEVYSISTDPKIIEDGATAFMQLITYLAADGYQIKTPLFNLKVSIPGEYSGTETHIPENTRPEGRLTASAELQEYLRTHIQLQFDGVKTTDGCISKVIDRITGEKNKTIHPGELFEIRGTGLKIAADDLHAADTGIYLESVAAGTRLRIDPRAMSMNESGTLITIAPAAAEIPPGSQWYVVVRTQASAKAHGGQLLDHVREMKSNFILNTP